MLRSNVLGLRKCSSARPICHGLRVRCFSSAAGLPVTSHEFQDVLAGLLKEKWVPRYKGPIGFAISGGVDSMALAALYAGARQTNTALPNAHGFIVDHRVRPESTEEAEWVAEQLRRKFDMEASVLPLTWPAGFDALNHKSFETDARMLRYQALGRACRANNISHLMVAHHADDQAETVIMRLMRNRLRSGLQGMHAVEWIPECYGLYGVHHSGQQQEPNIHPNIPFPIEKGGVQIVRPLLGFEKSRLIATCKTQAVAWAEDKTNSIQTYTSRNAVRHVYENHVLPAALGSHSLVQVSRAVQERIEAHKAYAQMLFDECLIKLDIQTGSMLVRLPPQERLLVRRIETDSDVNEARNNAYYLLERVAELITPAAKAPISQLAATIEHIWPQLGDSKDKALSDRNLNRSDISYCVYSVWWRWSSTSSPFDKKTSSKAGFEERPREWLLTRQMPSTNPAEQSNSQIVYPPTSNSTLTADPPTESTYQLFDGRYWIRLQNHTQDKLVLRFFNKDDMRHLPTAKALKEQRNAPARFMAKALGGLKPADLRFTLPAVFRINSTTGEESLVGFPTLDINRDAVGAPAGICEWSVRYKKIDTGSRAAEDIVVPGLRRKLEDDMKAKQARIKTRLMHNKAKPARAK